MPTRRKAAAPVLKEVRVLGGPTHDYPGRDDGLPLTVPDGHLRVFARSNVLGLVYGHWGDVHVDTRDLEACLRRGLVMLTDPTDGQPKFARLPPRTCCGNHATPGQH